MKDEAVINYLLTCAAFGMLYKRGASISAAKMGNYLLYNWIYFDIFSDISR